MSQGIVNIRMDETLKRNFDYICEELGMNMSTAITIFAKKVCREKKIPFEISLNNSIEVERVGVMPKTTFRVYVFPKNEFEEADGVIKDFDDFDEAFFYMREEINSLEEKMKLSEDEFVNRGDINFAIEFINPQNMYRQILTYDDELIYEHDNKKENISDIVPESEDVLNAIYSFVQASRLLGGTL